MPFELNPEAGSLPYPCSLFMIGILKYFDFLYPYEIIELFSNKFTQDSKLRCVSTFFSQWRPPTSLNICEGYQHYQTFWHSELNSQAIYLGGLSREIQPNFPLRKSAKTRKPAWWVSPLNKWIASFRTNLQILGKIIIIKSGH